MSSTIQMHTNIAVQLVAIATLHPTLWVTAIYGNMFLLNAIWSKG